VAESALDNITGEIVDAAYTPFIANNYRPICAS
jgi:hypothetical protein